MLVRWRSDVLENDDDLPTLSIKTFIYVLTIGDLKPYFRIKRLRWNGISRVKWSDFVSPVGTFQRSSFSIIFSPISLILSYSQNLTHHSKYQLRILYLIKKMIPVFILKFTIVPFIPIHFYPFTKTKPVLKTRLFNLLDFSIRH